MDGCPSPIGLLGRLAAAEIKLATEDIQHQPHIRFTEPRSMMGQQLRAFHLFAPAQPFVFDATDPPAFLVGYLRCPFIDGHLTAGILPIFWRPEWEVPPQPIPVNPMIGILCRVIIPNVHLDVMTVTALSRWIDE